MKRLFAFALALLCASAFAATLTPVQLLNPAGSTSGQVVTSSGPSSAPAWVTLPNGGAVTSVAGKTGAVTLVPSDVGAAALAGSSSQAFGVANATTTTQAEAHGQSISSGTLQTLTASRAIGTSYTNSTTHPIFVFVTCSNATSVAAAFSVLINGSVAGYATSSPPTTGFLTTSSFIVPAGATYEVAVYAGSPTLMLWTEIR